MGHTILLDTSAHWLEVVRALLTDGVPLNILSRENGLVRRLLEYRRGTLPLRTCSDLVPDLSAPHNGAEILQEVQEPLH